MFVLSFDRFDRGSACVGFTHLVSEVCLVVMQFGVWFVKPYLQILCPVVGVALCGGQWQCVKFEMNPLQCLHMIHRWLAGWLTGWLAHPGVFPDECFRWLDHDV